MARMMIGGVNPGLPGIRAGSPTARRVDASQPEMVVEGRGEPVIAPGLLLRPFSLVATDHAGPNGGGSNALGFFAGEAKESRLLPGAEGSVALSEFRKEVVLEDLGTLRQAGHLLAKKPGAADPSPCKAEAALAMMQERQPVYFQSASRGEPVAIKDFEHLRELALLAEQRVVG